MNDQKKQRGGARQNAGRKVTPYKVQLNVRITQEAADIMVRHPNKSEYIDEIIKKCEQDAESRRCGSRREEVTGADCDCPRNVK